ncbi:MAG: ATP-binding protein [Euryarchaeota archaeon]|nr:ATP-binding protein [Euryarchaeota archaeon]
MMGCVKGVRIIRIIGTKHKWKIGKRMEVTFYDREQETKEIMDTLRMKPRLITFIYGPINSGKAELITYLTCELPDDYVVFYINLRTKFLAGYDDFIESLLEIEMETDREIKKGKR